MQITIRVKPSSKTESVEMLPGGAFLVRVKAPAKEGKANEALVKVLGGHFDLPKSRISVASGLGSRTKIVDIC